MDPIEERPVFSRGDDVESFRMGLVGSLKRIGVRTNLQVPKDGSEVTEQISFTRRQYVHTPGDVSLTLEEEFSFFSIDVSTTTFLNGIKGGHSNAPGEGRVINITNVSSGPVRVIVLLHEGLSAPADERMILPGGISIVIVGRDSTNLFYDVISQRWRTRH